MIPQRVTQVYGPAQGNQIVLPYNGAIPWGATQLIVQNYTNAILRIGGAPGSGYTIYRYTKVNIPWTGGRTLSISQVGSDAIQATDILEVDALASPFPASDAFQIVPIIPNTFTAPIALGPLGGIYQGSGTFAAPVTGLKIYSDSSGDGVIEFWKSGVLVDSFTVNGLTLSGYLPTTTDWALGDAPGGQAKTARRVVGQDVAAPVGAGLFLGSDFLGYYSGSAWQVYIDDTGKFLFQGDATHYVQWDGTLLTVHGQVNVTDGLYCPVPTGYDKTQALNVTLSGVIVGGLATQNLIGTLYVALRSGVDPSGIRRAGNNVALVVAETTNGEGHLAETLIQAINRTGAHQNTIDLQSTDTADTQVFTADTVTINAHLLTSSGTPTVAAGSGAGASPPAPVLVDGDDVSGYVTFGTGSGEGSTPGLEMVVVTFATAFAHIPDVVICEAFAGGVTPPLNVGALTTTGFKVYQGTVGAWASNQPNTQYGFTYHVIGHP